MQKVYLVQSSINFQCFRISICIHKTLVKAKIIILLYDLTVHQIHDQTTAQFPYPKKEKKKHANAKPSLAFTPERKIFDQYGN